MKTHVELEDTSNLIPIQFFIVLSLKQSLWSTSSLTKIFVEEAHMPQKNLPLELHKPPDIMLLATSKSLIP